ncbi:hypothetical protein D8Y20_01370 [Mariprofundus sp. EBB-1]|uniref:hypothetical protein n=1 Tax=Mariprofundus sp. EBB-1 TaxID=2650971 RepID=UPI000EF265B6|nr:hypothetical protein [Mariprofundus sp. EBB-1]RLL55580.1 hypothetical protein D8Y20_01370 [Mariprofundus sp. EBB-1]
MKVNTLISAFLIGLLSIGVVSCGGGGGGTGASSASAGGNNTPQYTPSQAAWATFSIKPLASGINTSHDPNGIGWLTPASWQSAQWNGTVYNPETLTRTQLAAAICPTGDQIRGIREVFYATQPFANNMNPTKAEVDEWHRIAINHVRALVGYTNPAQKVKKDYCMFARALWGQERKFTTKWDAKYPGTVGSAYGPCQGGTNPHCGATFIPAYADQAPYLPVGHPGCAIQAGAEGTTSAPKSNIPWSIKWSRAFCGYLGSEGFWGGHVGPFFHREKFGFSFWDNASTNNNSNATLRAKWSGRLMNNLYIDPDGTGTMY